LGSFWFRAGVTGREGEEIQGKQRKLPVGVVGQTTAGVRKSPLNRCSITQESPLPVGLVIQGQKRIEEVAVGASVGRRPKAQGGRGQN